MLKNLILTFFVATAITPVSHAALISVDHATHGVDSITRDTDQGLDFLDLTLSTNRSFDDVSTQFGVGGDFEGFRYATEAEVIAFINNFGFIPAATAGSVTNGTAGGDQISGLVDLVGQTRLISTIRVSEGITSTVVSPSVQRNVRISDVAGAGEDLIDATKTSDASTGDSNYGSWLVTASPSSVPEPSSILLLGFGTVLSLAYHRKKKHAELKA